MSLCLRGESLRLRKPLQLLIVIVNYRSANMVVDCLRSVGDELRDHPQLGQTHVIVTDNGSGDDSVDVLNRAVTENNWQSWCEIKPLNRNGGFAFGNNGGIVPALKGDNPPEFVLLLNPDTVVRPGGIATLVEYMKNHANVGIAGSRLEDPDGTPQRSAFRFPSILGEVERSVRLGPVSKLLNKHMVAPPVPATAEPCDWVAGASMLVRKSVFDTIGHIDEQYFMYYEEVDFCLAAKRAGFECWYVPTSRVVHLVGAVSQLSDGRKHRKRRPGYWFEARRRYFLKNHGWIYAAVADVAFLIGFSLWRLRRLIQRKEDPDPPKLLWDSLRQSVFFHPRLAGEPARRSNVTSAATASRLAG